ncbi:MAG: hypothetical protein IJL87_02975 [Clostridia bacterium]|nr:hypothetical protein [Clostridia bacterium]
MLKKILSVAAALLLFCTVTLSAFATYDVDFSVKPQASTVKQGDTLVVNIEITTAGQGYVDFEMQLEYDESVFSCESTYNEDGYVGSGKNGIYTLVYDDPGGEENPNPTSKGDVVTVDVKFTVLQDAPTGAVSFAAKVKSCNGIDTLNLNAPVKLTLAKLYDKSVTVTEGDGTQITVDSNDPGETFENDVRERTDNSGSSGVDWKLVVGIIIGGIIVFFSGCIVGYLMQQKKSEGGADDGGYYPRKRGGRDYYDSQDDIDIGTGRNPYADSGVAAAATGVSMGTQTGNSFLSSTMTGTNTGTATFGGMQQPAQTAASTGYSGNSFMPSGTQGTFSTGMTASQQPAYAGQQQGYAPRQGYAQQPAQTQPQQGFSVQNPGYQTSAPQTAQQQMGSTQFTSRPLVNYGAGTNSAAVNSGIPQQPSYGVPQDKPMMEMAYRGEGTVGSYRPTPPAPPPAGGSGQSYGQNPSRSAVPQVHQPAGGQQYMQQNQPKQEYTIGRPGYSTGAQPAQQGGFSTTPSNQGGSYLPRTNGTQGTGGNNGGQNGSAPFSAYRR